MITSILNPNVGTATMLGPTSIRWNIAELGVSAPQSAALEFFVRHVAQTSGTKKVNASVDYSDNEGNVVDFPDPTVAVECDVVVHPEPCAVPTDLSVDGCSDAVVVDMGDTYLESLGRIIQLDVTVRNVCPGKRVALAVILTEVDENGEEYQRGMKAMTIPAHDSPTLPRHFGALHQVRRAGGFGCFGQYGPSVQPAQLQGALYCAQHRHGLPLLRRAFDPVFFPAGGETALCC